MAKQEFQYELKIPKDRIAVLIGVKGEVKKEIEERTNTKLHIDSEAGDVFIKSNDGLNIFNAKEIIMAIGRGFNPNTAMLLMKGDYVFDLINIKDYANTKKSELRLKGRVIGEEGKTRRIIEEMTDTFISVYGKTISLIGEPENCSNAKQAIVSLLQGSPHSSVYKWLEKKRKVKKEEQMFA